MGLNTNKVTDDGWRCPECGADEGLWDYGSYAGCGSCNHKGEPETFQPA